MKKGWLFSLSIFTLILLVISIKYGYETLKYGNQAEREKLLKAVMWELQQDGYTKNDIYEISIEYDYQTGGDVPYEAEVVFTKDKHKAVLYSWENKNQKKIIQDGSGYTD